MPPNSTPALELSLLTAEDGRRLAPRAASITSKLPITISSAEEYAYNVASHADPTTSRSLYSGANYDTLSVYLHRPYEVTVIVDGSRTLESSAPFVTLHDLSLPEGDENRIHEFSSIDTFTASIEQKRAGEKPSLLLFLRGHPSPEWLNTVGYLLNIDPEFLLRHLSFRIPPTERHFTFPAPPSTTSNIIKLRTTSIICPQVTDGQQMEVRQLRNEVENEMRSYYRNLRQGIDLKTGDSIVRSFVVHDNEHCTLEQDISVCVNDFGKGWIGLVWLDHGNDLSEGPRGPWSSPRERARSWKTFVIPTILHRPGIALKTRYISARKPQRDCEPVAAGPPRYPQQACTIHMHYGRFLDEKAAGIDAFYALSELFIFAATSESQFLNMVEQKILYEMDNLLGSDQSSSAQSVMHGVLSNLLYNKKLLDEHVRRLKENRATISENGSSKWPKATEEEPDVLSKVKIVRDSLIKDYDYLLERAITLSATCDRAMDIAGNNAMVAESRSAIRQAKWVGKLTLLAFFFIPASFTTSLFGMNFAQFGQGTLDIWVWFVVLVPVYIVSLFVLYIDLARVDFGRRLPKMNILRRGGRGKDTA